jgi:hypothetical protein
MPRPKHTKRDANHAQIVQELTQLGAVVWDLADLGGEVLDIIVFWRGQARPVEIKSTDTEDLTEKELHSIQRLQLVGVQPVVATRTEDILDQW